MQCPKCRLFNPPAALRCDCGHDFPTGVMKTSYITDPPRFSEGGRDRSIFRANRSAKAAVIVSSFVLAVGLATGFARPAHAPGFRDLVSMILTFPLTLVLPLVARSSHSGPLTSGALFGWALYLWIAIAIVVVDRKGALTALFTLLALMLGLNILFYLALSSLQGLH